MQTIFLIAVLSLAGAFTARAEDPLQAFLRQVDASAKGDMPGFHAAVSAQFGVPELQIRAVLVKVHDPADAFMVFQVAQMSHQPIERVMPVYQSHRKRGWGAIAQECGIKPGSPDFHRLKNGNLHYRHGGPHGKGHGKNDDHGNGHGNDHGDDNHNDHDGNGGH